MVMITLLSLSFSNTPPQYNYNDASSIGIHPDYVDSENYGERFHKINQQNVDAPSMIVLYYTGVPKNETLSIFTNPKTEKSYHYLIDKNGGITQIVPESKRAWHAGNAYWKGDQDINTISIGIGIENIGYHWKNEHPNNGVVIPGSNEQWYPFDHKAINALIPALKSLIQKYKILPSMIVGQSDVRIGLNAPGPFFPWKKLAQHGIGMWYDLNKPLMHVILPNTTDPVFTMPWAMYHLDKVGYKTPLPTDTNFNEQSQLVIKSFQMHFRPTKIDGQLDDETIKIVASIADQYGQY
jgi:N-acetyl-anhydromuramyl-L-alanine amidase AmpD